MELKFYKYEGAGNDFVIIDNRSGVFDAENADLISRLCDRKFGVGGDGLMLLEDHDEQDFLMRYFNADGNEASMCGNGGRCIVAFAKRLGAIGNKTRFAAVDGEHEAVIEGGGIVNLKMANVSEIEMIDDDFLLDTGSPHYVKFVDNIDAIDIYSEGKKIRYSERFSPQGANVNFVSIDSEHLTVYTYERGVEDETLACGTGITAAVLSAAVKTGRDKGVFAVTAKGGELSVAFERTLDGFENIWLKGPATFVFEGVVKI